ncbi:MAG: polyprenyl diphosphate synthase [Candidatus Woesearchaeota archaeon]
MNDLLAKVKKVFGFSKKKLDVPEHVALNIDGIERWALETKKPVNQAYSDSFFNLYRIIREQVNYEIKTLSIGITPPSKENSGHFTKELASFLTELEKDEAIIKNHINVQVIGKWYQMSHEVVEPIKSVMSKTSKFDKFKLIICLNYDGRQELIDACKLIARKVSVNHLDPQSISDDTIKQNLYASNLPQVNLLIMNGKENIRGSFLLWLSTDAIFYQTDKCWPEFAEEDFLKAIVEYNQ